MSSTAPTLRDSAKPSEYYQAFVTKEEGDIAGYTSYNNPGLYFSVAPKCIRIARATYSAGASRSECVEWLAQAANYQYRFLAEGKKFALGGPGNVDDYLELHSGAFLAGQSEKLGQARRQCTYTEKTHPVVGRLIAQFLDLLEGKVVHVTDKEAAEALAVKKEWGCLPPLFAALSARDVPKATAAMEQYLTGSWGPAFEKWAKTAVKAQAPEYTGKWSIFSAAACMILGRVPDLSAKAKIYVPVDLVQV